MRKIVSSRTASSNRIIIDEAFVTAFKKEKHQWLTRLYAKNEIHRHTKQSINTLLRSNTIYPRLIEYLKRTYGQSDYPKYIDFVHSKDGFKNIADLMQAIREAAIAMLDTSAHSSEPPAKRVATGAEAAATTAPASPSLIRFSDFFGLIMPQLLFQNHFLYLSANSHTAPLVIKPIHNQIHIGLYLQGNPQTFISLASDSGTGVLIFDASLGHDKITASIFMGESLVLMTKDPESAHPNDSTPNLRLYVNGENTYIQNV